LAPCVHYAHSPVPRVLEPRFHPIDRSKRLPSGSASQDAWNRALNWIDTDKFDSQFTNLRTPTHDSLTSQMPKIERHAAIHTTVFEFFSDGEQGRRAGAFVILLSSWIVLTANGDRCNYRRYDHGHRICSAMWSSVVLSTMQGNHRCKVGSKIVEFLYTEHRNPKPLISMIGFILNYRALTQGVDNFLHICNLI
jgi:hypothetical protein